MRALVLSTSVPERCENGHVTGEYDLTAAAAAIVAAYPRTEAVEVRGSVDEILAAINSYQPEVVFNLCEAPLGRPDLEAHAAALLEWTGIAFTGSSSETLSLCRRKDRTQAVLAAAGIPVPRARVFPCIVKPADQDGSAGIDTSSICDSEAAVSVARSRIPGPLIVEEFLPGREFVISLWGPQAENVSIGEADFQNGLKIYTYAAKWELESPDYQNAWLAYDSDIEPSLRDQLIGLSRQVWRAVGARGYMRLDVRLDALDRPHVIDVNPNPEVTPGMGMHRAVTEAGWSWEEFWVQQVQIAKMGAKPGAGR